MTGLRHDAQLGRRQPRGHAPVDVHELVILGPDDQQRGGSQLRQSLPQRRLRARAHAAQAVGQAGGAVGQPLAAQFGLSLGRQPRQAGEERQPLPFGDEAGHAVAFNAQGESLIGGAALLALGGRGQAGRGAFQQQCADGPRVMQRGIEGQTAAHRVTQPVGGPGGAALQNFYQVSGDAKYRVASGIDRGVAAAVAGQVDGEHAAARRHLRPQAAPRGCAAGKAVEQQ